MSNYSKLLGSIVGSVVAMVFVYLASKGLATCSVAADGSQACSIFGFTDVQITAVAGAAVSALFVWAFPKNTA